LYLAGLDDQLSREVSTLLAAQRSDVSPATEALSCRPWVPLRNIVAVDPYAGIDQLCIALKRTSPMTAALCAELHCAKREAKQPQQVIEPEVTHFDHDSSSYLGRDTILTLMRDARKNSRFQSDVPGLKTCLPGTKLLRAKVENALACCAAEEALRRAFCR
jgi:hypothetical protein